MDTREKSQVSVRNEEEMTMNETTSIQITLHVPPPTMEQIFRYVQARCTSTMYTTFGDLWFWHKSNEAIAISCRDYKQTAVAILAREFDQSEWEVYLDLTGGQRAV